MEIGSWYLGNHQCDFTLWAPLNQTVELHLLAPDDKLIPLKRDAQGYWRGTAEVEPGTLYWYRLDGELDRPDPASHSQPEGVHGPSQVIDQQSFAWTDASWSGIPLEQMIIYELHVGTFTPEGTFEAIIERLPDLQALGVNTIELMPVAQFPGDRNWGYDGVFPYAVQNSYGGVEGLKRLVDACHRAGMAILLDVVYNHLGPEGNYLWGIGTYFTDRYKTPWGSAINYDDAYSSGVRNYFVENVLYWLRDYHLDGLRLDAVHAIYDFGAKHILQEMAEATHQLSEQQGHKRYLIAESDLNDPRIIRPVERGGYSIDAQWSDDFHHAVHTLLTGESFGYYEDYGQISHLAKAYRDSFVYDWRYSAHRKRFHGGPTQDCHGSQFVVCIQNHDQVGNRMLGDRFSHLVSFEAQKLGAATLMLAPNVPMLFMGEEYGETAPFLYFVSHSDPALVEGVRAGRKAEFAAFHAQGEAPDPQAVETFKRSKLNWELHQQGQHHTLWQFYQTLIAMRRDIPALNHLDRQNMEVVALDDKSVLKVRRWHQNSQILCLLNFEKEPIQLTMALPPGIWKKRLDSADTQWGGPGSELPDLMPTDRRDAVAQQPLTLAPQSVVIYGIE